MISKTLLAELSIKFVNVHNQCNDFYFFNQGLWTPEFLKSQFGHPVMKILAKSLLSNSAGISLSFLIYCSDSVASRTSQIFSIFIMFSEI